MFCAILPGAMFQGHHGTWGPAYQAKSAVVRDASQPVRESPGTTRWWPLITRLLLGGRIPRYRRTLLAPMRAPLGVHALKRPDRRWGRTATPDWTVYRAATTISPTAVPRSWR